MAELNEPRKKRAPTVPERAQGYVNANLPTLAANAGLTQQNAAVKATQSHAPAGTPSKRNIVVPARAMEDVEHRAALKAKHEGNLQKAKRKAEAEARGNASQPAPLSPPPKRSKTSSTSTNILMLPYSHLTNEPDRVRWLRHALIERNGVDPFEEGMSSVELKEMFDDPDATELEPSAPPNGITAGKTVVMHRGRPAATVRGTDHTTIGLGNPLRYPELARDLNGKPVGPIILETQPRRSSLQATRPSSNPATPPALPTASGSRPNPTDSGLVAHANPSVSGGPTMPRTPTSIAHRTTQGLPARTTPSIHPAVNTKKAPVASAGTHANANANAISKPKGPLAPNSTGGVANSSRAPGALTNLPSSAPRQTVSTSHGQARPAASNHSASTVAPQAVAHRTTVAPLPTPTSRSDPRRNPQVPQLGADMDQQGQGPEFEGEQDLDNLEPEEANIVGLHAPRKETKRQQAQLHKFGPAERLVNLLAERIKVRAPLECPFADIMPSPDQVDAIDEHESRSRTLLDDWLAEEWPSVNEKLRACMPVLPFDGSYRRYVRAQFPHLRHDMKLAIVQKVAYLYGFERDIPCQENIDEVKRLEPDCFHSPNLARDKYRFQHPIIGDAIKDMYFANKQGLGYRYWERFQGMPSPLLAFATTITRHCIREYRTGSYQAEHLDAQDLVEYYRMYLDTLTKMATPGNEPTRLRNYQGRLFLRCHGPPPTEKPLTVRPTPIIWESDSEAEDFGFEPVRKAHAPQASSSDKGKGRALPNEDDDDV